MSPPIDYGDDIDLLLKLNEGDQSAFGALYRKYWTYVYDNSFKRIKDPTLAEDVTQDVFVQLWNARRSGEIANLKGYLYISVRNRVFRLFERQSKFVPIEEVISDLKNHTIESSDTNLLFKELSEAYALLLLDLTEQQQVIYDLKYAQDLSADEIAERLNLSPKTVRNQIGKINFKLRSSILGVQIVISILFL